MKIAGKTREVFDPAGAIVSIDAAAPIVIGRSAINAMASVGMAVAESIHRANLRLHAPQQEAVIIPSLADYHKSVTQPAVTKRPSMKI